MTEYTEIINILLNIKRLTVRDQILWTKDFDSTNPIIYYYVSNGSTFEIAFYDKELPLSNNSIFRDNNFQINASSPIYAARIYNSDNTLIKEIYDSDLPQQPTEKRRVLQTIFELANNDFLNKVKNEEKETLNNLLKIRPNNTTHDRSSLDDTMDNLPF